MTDGKTSEIHALDHAEPSRNYEAVPFKTAEEWAIERFGIESTKLLRAPPDVAVVDYDEDLGELMSLNSNV